MASKISVESSSLIINGSLLEGGGQLLRNAVSIACVKSKPIKIVKIRAGREKPGLKNQHLCGLNLSKLICSADMEGLKLDSSEISINPGIIKAGKYTSNTKSAGSVMLVFQIALPILIFGREVSELELIGGTNAQMAPPVDYISMVFRPIAQKFGINFNLDIIKRGYYPKGGGRVNVTIDPVKQLTPINMLAHGTVTKIIGRAYVAGKLPMKLCNLMADSAEQMIRKILPDVSIDILRIQEPNAIDNASGIILMAETDTGCVLGGSSMGERNKLAELVGEQAADELLYSITNEVCVDKWMQDQIIIFMALASGASYVKCGPITLHTSTSIYIAEQLTGARFTIKTLDSAKDDYKKYPCIIECSGSNQTNLLL